MRKIFNLAAVAVMAMAAVSCAKDTTDFTGGETDQAGNKFTFVLPTQGGTITYAGEVEASANEKKLDLLNTSIFMFDSAGDLEAVIDGLDITSGTSPAGKPTATINIAASWAGNKTFYLVGNTNMGAAANLPTETNIGTMTSTEFLELTTEAQTGAISSADGLLMAGYAAVTNVEQASSTDLSLYRSVARFDIAQDVTENKVTIKSIDVIDANTNGYITAYGRGVKASGLTKGDINNIAVSQTLTTEDVDGTPGDTSDDHSFQRQNGVMYLYPTHLKTDGTGTTILLIGEMNGQEAIYTLNKEESDLPVNCEIQANKRYIISVQDDITTGTFTITAADWDGSDELTGQSGNVAGAFGIASPMSGSALTGNYNPEIGWYNVKATGGQLTFSVKASSSLGTIYKMTADTNVEDHTSLYSVSVSNASTVSYATPYFESTYTITVPDMSAKNTGKTTLTIADAKNHGERLSINLVFTPGIVNGKLKIDEYNFPDPAFRSYVETTLGLTGEVTQAQLDAVTTIKLPPQSGIVSLVGLEHFKEIRYLYLGGYDDWYVGDNLTISGHVDLTNFRMLSRCFANVTNISSFDVTGLRYFRTFSIAYPNSVPNIIGLSTLSNLDGFGLYGKNYTSVDLTGLTKLRILALYDTNISSLDLSLLPELMQIGVPGAMETIDFSQNPKLVQVVVGNRYDYNPNKIKVLDISKNPLVSTLSLTDCPDIETVKVWSGFPIDNPESGFTSYYLWMTPEPNFVIAE